MAYLLEQCKCPGGSFVMGNVSCLCGVSSLGRKVLLLLCLATFTNGLDDREMAFRSQCLCTCCETLFSLEDCWTFSIYDSISFPTPTWKSIGPPDITSVQPITFTRASNSKVVSKLKHGRATLSPHSVK